MLYIPDLPPEVRAWLDSRGYHFPVLFAKGSSAGVWRVERNGIFFALKMEHAHSTRSQMAVKEEGNLRMANGAGVGPRLVESSAELRLILMEFVEGIPLGKWLALPRASASVQRVVQRLFAQARALDAAGLDHGQLGGRLHNILIGPREEVWIIDFEKASPMRKPHNVNKIRARLFRSNPYLTALLHNHGVKPEDF